MGRDLINRIFGGPLSETGPTAPPEKNPGLYVPKGGYIPDYRIYKIEDAPELLDVQRRLAARGIKSYWLRNDVWRYNQDRFGTRAWRAASLLTYGWKWAIPMLIVTVIYENYFNKDDSHGHHGSGHNGHGNHSTSHH